MVPLLLLLSLVQGTRQGEGGEDIMRGRVEAGLNVCMSPLAERPLAAASACSCPEWWSAEGEVEVYMKGTEGLSLFFEQ